MPRVPRAVKQLRAGFAAEAGAAARFRAYADRADAEALPNLARHWRRLARAKDELASSFLAATDPLQGGLADLEQAIIEERRKSESFYPEMASSLDEVRRSTVDEVLADQRQHLAWMEALHGALTVARGDVEAPVD